MPKPGRSSVLLAIIVCAQFAGTSLWFAGNAIMGDISRSSATGFANITSIVQFGFIAGTLVFSLLTIADRFPARQVFFFSALIASGANLLLVWTAKDTAWLFSLRFITGFFLAGIYPVGMKIAADLFPEKLGNALGWLVGALVLGTAFPYVLRSQLKGVAWQEVLVLTSLLSLLGGFMIVTGTPRVKGRTGPPPHFSAGFRVFRSPDFRAAAFGYFGHMWELYTFWAFLPLIMDLYNQHQGTQLSIPFWSFLAIAVGGLGCIAGGRISRKTGSKKVAFASLFLSGLCCALSPFLFFLPTPLFLLLLLLWGTTVVSDSPQFSALVARTAPQQEKGTALTMVTSIGFTITIVSIQLIRPAVERWQHKGFLLLLIGPLAGLWWLHRYNRN